MRIFECSYANRLLLWREIFRRSEQPEAEPYAKPSALVMWWRRREWL